VAGPDIVRRVAERPPAASDYRSESLAGWQAVAPAWERRNDEQWEATAPVSRTLVEQLALRPGETVLELAAGVGQTGLLAAEAVGVDGRLISSDFSAAMVEAAERLAAKLGVTNVEHRIIDAEDIDLADASVDAVVCRWGFMLFADPARALAEARRVLRPGGRLAFAVWAAPDRNPWSAIVGRTLVERGLVPPPEPGAPGQFSLASPERIEELCGAAGFDSVLIEEVPLTFEFSSFDAYWAAMLDLGRAISAAVAELEPTARAEVRAQVERNAEPYRTDGGYHLPGSSLAVLAR
jgi:SAM-dependent methyltransferase